ncbi:hypothetical protein Trydic_g18741 [Trypoxylus dichotomus]
MGVFTILTLFTILGCVVTGSHPVPDQTKEESEDIDPSFLLDEILDVDIVSRNGYSSKDINLIKCEEYHHHSKIFGGRDAKSRELPHMAALGYGPSNNITWRCGGSLISERFVLTAAHCLRSGNLCVQHVRLGDIDIKSDKDDTGVQQFTVEQTFIHPSVKSPARYHDIALLRLSAEVLFTEYVIPACVGLSSDLNQTAPTVAGWGLTENGPSNTLKIAPVEYVPTSRCNRAYGHQVSFPRGVMDSLAICAGGINGTDTCQGDSGGPLQIINDSYDFGSFPEIVGITSLGALCGELPGLYTRVYHYLPWIIETIWQ